jgi:hypothetical protein
MHMLVCQCLRLLARHRCIDIAANHESSS